MDLPRHFYVESMINHWIIIAMTCITAAVLVHINLNYIIGSVIIFDGLAMFIVTLIGAIGWLVYGDKGIGSYMKLHRVLLYIKIFLCVICIGLFVWAAVIMIQNAAMK